MRSAPLASSKNTATRRSRKEPQRVPAAMTCTIISLSAEQLMPRPVCRSLVPTRCAAIASDPFQDLAACVRLSETFVLPNAEMVFHCKCASINGLSVCVLFVLLCEERGVKKQCHSIGPGATAAWTECCSRPAHSRRKKPQAGFCGHRVATFSTRSWKPVYPF